MFTILDINWTADILAKFTPYGSCLVTSINLRKRTAVDLFVWLRKAQPIISTAISFVSSSVVLKQQKPLRLMTAKFWFFFFTFSDTEHYLVYAKADSKRDIKMSKLDSQGMRPDEDSTISSSVATAARLLLVAETVGPEGCRRSAPRPRFF